MLEDLYQDCNLNSKLAPVLYVFTYYRKLAFALFLNPVIPGIVQVVLLMFINFLQFFIVVYMVSNRLYTSKLKIITRTINLICVLGIEAMILSYNINDYSIEKMILIGVSCTYLTIIATIAGIF